MELNYIGQMVHDIEVNIWEKKGLDETRIVQDAIIPIMKKSKGNDEVIEATWGYFDLVYQKLITNHHNEEGSSYHRVTTKTAAVCVRNLLRASDVWWQTVWFFVTSS